MCVEVTYANGDKKIFIIDENMTVLTLIRMFSKFGSSVKNLEFM